MRSMLMGASAVLLTAISAVAAAGESTAPVPPATLAQMGLGSMQVLSDADALRVRGMGTRVRVFGPTYNVTRSNFAARGNFSISIGGGISGGFSSAWAR